jgi:hypothetical protein
MSLLGGADELGVGNVEPYPEFLEPLMKFIDMFLRAHTRVISGLLDFLPMLIGAGQEKDFNPFEAFVTGNHIRRDGGVGMAYMGNIVHVINRSGDIKLVLLHGMVFPLQGF